jgi:hypothetical protein
VGEEQGRGSKPPGELEKARKFRRAVAKFEAQVIVWVGIVVGVLIVIAIVLRLAHAI